jgi:hypothetical protein
MKYIIIYFDEKEKLAKLKEIKEYGDTRHVAEHVCSKCLESLKNHFVLFQRPSDKVIMKELYDSQPHEDDDGAFDAHFMTRHHLTPEEYVKLSSKLDKLVRDAIEKSE